MSAWFKDHQHQIGQFTYSELRARRPQTAAEQVSSGQSERERERETDSWESDGVTLAQGRPAVSTAMMKPAATGRLMPLKDNLTYFTCTKKSELTLLT